MSFLRRALVALALLPTSSVFAQGICWQENGGPAFHDPVFMGPAGITSVRVVATFDFTVTGAEVFSGETPGAANIALFTDDPVAAKPAAKFAQADFSIGAALGFQGADFHAPIAIDAGDVFWIGWSLPFTAQAPVEPPKQAVGQFYRTSLDGGASWLGPFQFATSHFKFRLRGPCGPCAGFTDVSGPGCNGVGGVPELVGGGCPGASHAVSLRVAFGPSSAASLLTIGLGTTSGPVVPLCSIHNLPLAPLSIPFVLDPQGGAVLVAVLPPSILPGDLYLQCLIADSAMFSGISATPALHVAIR